LPNNHTAATTPSAIMSPYTRNSTGPMPTESVPGLGGPAKNPTTPFIYDSVS
jgi:hypothetical protein